MKKVYEHRWIAVLLIMLCTFSSCTSYFFVRPQPVDAKDIRTFPAAYRHSWLDEDSTVINIHKSDLELNIREGQTFVRGFQSRDQNGYRPYGIYQYRIVPDLSGNGNDTVTNFIERGGMIYEIGEDGELSRGRTYLTDHDTLTAGPGDTIRIDLGRNAFLRKIGKDLYALNIKASVTGQNSNWWTLYIFGMDKDGTLATYGHAGKTQQLPEMFYKPSSGKRSDAYYFDANWTRADMTRMISEGYFEKESNLKRH